MEKTWKPTVGGILSIVAGAFGVIGGIITLAFGVGVGLPGMPGGGIFAAMVIPMIILGAVAIVGGIYALKRRTWGLGLAGSICSLFCFWPLGIPAIVFVILGKGEFE